MFDSMFRLFYHSLSFIGIYCSVKFIYDYLTKKSSAANSDLERLWFHKVVFFPDQGICSTGNPDRSKSEEVDPFKDTSLPPNIMANISRSSSLVYLLKFIRNAKVSLDLCLLIFTLSELKDSIIEAKKRGVHVRIIMDKTMSDCDGSCLPLMQKENISVLRGPTSMMVHHKFVLADAAEETGMIATGSLNWTWGAVTSNYENLIITNNPNLVGPFHKEFERLWTKFSTQYKTS